MNKQIPPFSPKPDADWLMHQEDVERIQEFRKCIECFLCQNVCHVLRDHDLKKRYFGPRFFVRIAALEMHPLDDADRTDLVKDAGGISLCNITKCCTEVCPEGIKITDNAIIPLKERVADRHYDPLFALAPPACPTAARDVRPAHRLDGHRLRHAPSSQAPRRIRSCRKPGAACAPMTSAAAARRLARGDHAPCRARAHRR